MPTPTAEIRTLKNADGSLIIYPETTTEAIFSPTLGTNIEGVFNNIDYLDQDQTITGHKTFTSNTLQANYPIINLQQTGAVSTYTGGHGIDFFVPNLVNTGILTPLWAGQSNTTGNSAGMQIQWKGDNADASNMAFSFYNKSGLIRIYNSGAVGINTAINDGLLNSYKLYVTGNTVIENGCLSIKPNSQTSYSQGIRIHSKTNDWGLIEFCADDNINDTGTSTNSWLMGIMGATGNFYINQAGANASKRQRIWGSSTGWTFGATTINDCALNAENLHIAGTATIDNVLQLYRSTSIANNYPAKIEFRVNQTDNSVTGTGAWIEAYDDHDTANNGLNMVIGACSNLIIGSGESARQFYNNETTAQGSSENLYLTTDNRIYMYTNCNTIANRRKALDVYGAMVDSYNTIRCIDTGFVAKNTTITKGVAPSANKYAAMIFRDANDVNLGWLQFCQYTSGVHRLELKAAVATDNTTTTGGGFHIERALGNTSSYSCSYNANTGEFTATKVWGAVWNDYAEYRETKKDMQPGRCIKEYES